MKSGRPDLILLAAGHSIGADGIIKCLIKHPVTRKNILETAREIFSDFNIRVVVGYRALEIISEYPEFSYEVNNEWSFTGNAYSLASAIRRNKTLVLAGDLYVTEDLLSLVKNNFNKSIVFSAKNERRRGSAINLKVSDQNKVLSQYSGKMDSLEDPESLGAVWIGDPETSNLWKQECERHPEKFAAECLPLKDSDFFSVEVDQTIIHEITDAMDYLKFKNFSEL